MQSQAACVTRLELGNFPTLESMNETICRNCRMLDVSGQPSFG